MNYLEKALDLDLRKSRTASHGLAVAQTIERLLTNFHPLRAWLDQAERDYLAESAEHIKAVASAALKTPRKTHPLNRFKASSPIYASLANDERLEQENDAATSLLDLARYVMLIAACKHTLPATSLIATCNFIHQLPIDSIARTQLRPYLPAGWDADDIKASADNLRSDIQKDLVSGPRAEELHGILEHLLQTVHGVRKNQRQRTGAGATRKAVEQSYNVKVASRAKSNNQNDDEESTPQVRFSNLAKSPEDHSSRLEPELTLDEGADGKDSEHKVRTFNQHGHHIRLNRAFAGMSSEAFTDPEARQAIASLLALPTSSPEQEAAKLIWILTALFGRLFDDIAPALLTSADANVEHIPDGGIVSIVRRGSTFVITLRHIIASRLPEAPRAHLANQVQTEFKLCCQLPESLALDDGWEFLTSTTATDIDERIDALLSAKDEIRKVMRSQVERFNETRLRGSVIQAVFMQDYDLPLTQLLFSERVMGSFAALHYLSKSNKDLQDRWLGAIQYLYGDKFRSAPLANADIWVGAAKSQILPVVFDKAIAEMNRLLQSLRRLSPENVAEHINRRAQLACIALGLGAAHRINYELGKLRIHDLCLHHGLVIFRDKPSDSAVYRRIAVIPTFALAFLRQYLSLLSDVGFGTINAPSDIKVAALAAFQGKRDLFIQVEETEIKAFDAARWLNSFLPVDIDVNQMRHLQSTQLRELGAPPFLVETHLGHGFLGLVFGDYGLVSPRELAATLRPYLDQFFKGFAIRVPKTIQHPAHRWITGKGIQDLESQEKASDTKLLLRQVKEEIKEGSLRTRRDVITEVFSQHIPGYSPATLPKGTVVTEATALAIRSTLIERTADNLLTVYRVCREARLRLKSHRSDPECTIAIPPATSWEVRPPLSITCAHFAAGQQLSALEKHLLNYIANTETPDYYLVARCALMIWGTCKLFAETEAWLMAFAKTPLIKGAEFQPIDFNGKSRTLTGPALLCALSWLKQGGRATNSDPSEIFGPEISIETLDITIAYARHIILPPLFADIVNMVRPNAELPRERLLDLVYNRLADRSKEPQQVDSPSRDILSRPPVQSKRQLSQFYRLRSFIPKDEESRAPARDVLIEQIRQWRQNTEDLSEVSYLLAHWAEILLGPHANKHNSKTLKRDTVRDYLYEAWSVLSAPCATGNILNYELDELTGILEAALPANPLTADRRANAINRLFYEMGNIYELPAIALKRSGNDPWAAIDAGVITLPEYEFVDSILMSWAESDQLHAHLSAGLGQMRTATQLMHRTGMRISEVARLRDSDVINTGREQVILLRPHADRSIKTQAGKRTLILQDNVTLPPNPQRRNHFFDYLQSEDNERLLITGLSRAIKFATHDTNGVPHRFRHTRASTSIAFPAYQENAITRIRELSLRSAALGHANVGVTFQYYIHTSHFHIAIELAKTIPPLENVILAKLFNEAPSYLRKRIQRMREGSSLESQYAFGLTSTDTNAKRPYPPLPPVPPLLAGGELQFGVTSIKTTAKWLTACARGIDAFDAAADLPLTTSALNALSTALQNTQASLGWRLIDPNRLRKIAPAEIGSRSSFQEYSALHRYIPPGWIDIQLSNMRDDLTDIPRIALQHLGGLRLRPRHYVEICCLPDEIERLLGALEHIGFKMKADKGQNGYKLLPRTDMPETKLDRNLARFVVLAILTHERIAQNQ